MQCIARVTKVGSKFIVYFGSRHPVPSTVYSDFKQAYSAAFDYAAYEPSLVRVEVYPDGVQEAMDEVHASHTARCAEQQKERRLAMFKELLQEFGSLSAPGG